jgi:hypothetical protein
MAEACTPVPARDECARGAIVPRRRGSCL